MAKITYLPPFADKENPAAWRVEGRNEDTGDIRITIFGGPEAEKLAAEYYAFKTNKLPVPAAKPTEVVAGTSMPFDLNQREIIITTRQGHKVSLYPNRTEWSYDVRKNQLTAFTKPAVELIEKGEKSA